MKPNPNATMTAAVLYGSEDLKIEQIGIPAVGPDEVLVRVNVALTCGTDLKVWKQGYHAKMIKPPSVFGHELAGVIASVGSAVRDKWAVGMRVVPANSAPCGQCFFCRKNQDNLCEDLLFNNGAYAEYIRIPGRIVEKNLLQIPDHVPFQDAALIEPLACVLHGIHETRLVEGDTCVVIGCGPIGLKFIRVLSARGVKVLAIGKRTNQMKAAERLGAHAAFDVEQNEYPIAAVRHLTDHGLGADAVVEAVGRPQSSAWALEMVRPGGVVNLFGGCARGTRLELDPARLHYEQITIRPTFHHTPQFIREALETVSRGQLRAGDLITGEIALPDLPAAFEKMKRRNGELKTAVIP